MKFSKKMLVLAGYLLLAATVFGRTYYIPHIHTANDSWETYLIVDNFYDCGPQGFHLTLYSADGSVLVDRRYYEVAGGQSLVVSLRPLNGVAGEVECGSNSMRFRLGYVAKDSTGGGTAEFDLPSKLSDTVVFSTSNYYNQLTWSGFAVFNGSDSDVTANVTIMTVNGKAATQLTIPAKEKVVNYFDAQFGVAFSDITGVIFSADANALTGITISGNENEKLLFTATGADRSGWKVRNHVSYSWVNGLGLASNTVLAFCFRMENSTRWAYMKGITPLDGSVCFEESDSYTNLFPVGLVTDFSNSVAIAYGLDLSDSTHTYFFVARVNPDDGTLLWKTNLAESVDLNTFVDNRAKQRICVATNGSSTVQANMRNKDGFMTRALIDVNTGVIKSASQTAEDLIPTTLIFDSVTGNYLNIYSQYDSASYKYSKVTFYKNNANSLTGVGSTADLSYIFADAITHDVLVYGGAILNGTVHLLYKVSIGSWPSYGKVIPMDAHPAQFIIGTVPANNFWPRTTTLIVTNETGLMGDAVNVVSYGLNTAYAFCGDVSSDDSTFRTHLISYSGLVRTLPINVRSASDNGVFLIAYEQEKREGPEFTMKGRRGFTKDIFPNANTWIEEVTLPDLLYGY
ncbi:MAG: hypothetical protein GXO69_00180 [Acidobacteria bacterium]|nr:hypothetical protein [Acidobacteriota bacterium]